MNINWLLISYIYSGLSCLEARHMWDLDHYEYAKFTESLYNSLVNKDVQSISESDWIEIFNNAYTFVYGSDHKCDNISKEEIWTFVSANFY